MQPLDPRMFGGATQSDTQDDGTSVLPKGSDVWYLHRSGTWQPARVIAVDETMLPAFYQIEMLEDGTVRDTERPRLKKRLPAEQVPPASDARGVSGASLPSATRLQPVAAGPTPTQVDGAVPSLSNQTYPQPQQQPGVQATNYWPQQSTPNPSAQAYAPNAAPGTQPHSQYPAQYHHAQMQGAPVAGASYPYQQAHQYGVPPSGHQTPAQWHSQPSWQQPQAFTGYMPAQMQPQHGSQQSWNVHQAQNQSAAQYFQQGGNFQNVGHQQSYMPQHSYMHGQIPSASGAVPQTAPSYWQGQAQGIVPNPSFPSGAFTPGSTMPRK